METWVEPSTALREVGKVEFLFDKVLVCGLFRKVASFIVGVRVGSCSDGGGIGDGGRSGRDRGVRPEVWEWSLLRIPFPEDGHLGGRQDWAIFAYPREGSVEASHGAVAGSSCAVLGRGRNGTRFCVFGEGTHHLLLSIADSVIVLL